MHKASTSRSRLARSIASALERLENRVLFSTASFVKIDAATQGNWSGTYGTDGYSVIGASASLPGYATYSVTGNSFYQWEGQNSGDVRALQTYSGSPLRIAATDYSPTSVTYNLNISDGKTHQVAFYVLDADARNRAETITIADGTSNTVLVSNDVKNFSGGDYVVYDISGNVKVTISNDAGSLNAVNSGIFFDPGPGGAGTVTGAPGSATLVATDTTTRGSWTGVYGGDGYSVAGGTTSLPAYATFGVSGNMFWQWQAPGTSDTRALQVKAGDSQRTASAIYTNTSQTFNLNLTDGKTHQVALYLLDGDNRGRTETVTVTDGTSNTVLSTTNVSNFSNGEYLVYNLAGNVKITITNGSGSVNAVASGLFFGPATNTGSPTTLTVGPGKQFGTIQAAVNAASPGDTIDVYSGTYTEQVHVPLGLDNLTLESAPGQNVTIKAPSALDSTGAIVRVDGAQNTVLQGFTITGPGAAPGALQFGVLVDAGGTATIQNNDVTGIEDATFGGSDTGYGIAVTDGSAKILDNIVDNYQKGGILIGLTPSVTGSSTWTQVGDVEGNYVTGVGGQDLVTQNGIIFSGLRATGTAKMNHVTGNTYTADNPSFGNAAGILLFNAGNSISVLNNIAYSNDTDIVVDGGSGAPNTRGSNFAIVSGNTVYDATAFDGIDLTDGVTQVTVSQNYSHNNPFDGIFIDGSTSGNTISNNTFVNNGEVDINDVTYSPNNFSGSPLYGTKNFYSNNIFGTSNDTLIPSA